MRMVSWLSLMRKFDFIAMKIQIQIQITIPIIRIALGQIDQHDGESAKSDYPQQKLYFRQCILQLSFQYCNSLNIRSIMTNISTS